MENSINVKRKNVQIIYGFYGDINYGVHYPTLVNNIELTELFPLLNQGETEITGRWDLTHAIFAACSDLKCSSMWENAETKKYRLYANIMSLTTEPAVAVCFRIVENQAA